MTTATRLSGPQKAAALVLALGDDQAAALLGRLHDDEVRDLSAAMASLGPVPAPRLEELCREFAEALGRAGGLAGGAESAERLLLKALPPERVAQIMEEIRGPAGRTMWDKLGNVHEAVLANYLKNEYPQTVAVVLSKVKPDHAARVLSLLPEGFALEVVMRMLRMEAVQREALEGVERTLRADFMSNLARAQRRDAHEAMAEIFNNLDRHAETRLLAALEERNRDDAERIRGLMFTFEDLHRVDGLPPDTYVLRVKEIEAARGQLRPPMHLAIDPAGGVPAMAGERTAEPTFGLPALWIEEALRDEALARGCTVVDAAGVLATHLTETVREHMPELLSFAETQKLLDELPREHQKLVADVVPAQISVGGVQRVLQALLAERVSIRDLPTILEGVQEATAGGQRGMSGILSVVRAGLARQLSDAARGANGYVPLITLSAEWEMAFAEALVGPPEERQLAMAPSRLGEFMEKVRDRFDAAAAAGESPALVCSGGVRGHVRAIVERFRPATTVLAQAEIHPRARIRTVGSV
jgi:flagellar motor switch protein FliG